MHKFVAAILAVCCSAGTCAEFDLDTQCLDCHRPGQTRGEIPLIEGQNFGYLRVQLQRFRDRHRLSFPMSALAAGLDDEVVESIALTLSRRPWTGDAIAVAPRAVKRGRHRAAKRSCDGCHGEGFLGSEEIPRIAGQQPGYLARQIGAFGYGHRYHPPTGTGSPMSVVTAGRSHGLGRVLSFALCRKTR